MKSNLFLSVCYASVAMFSFVLLAILILDQQTNSENCLISRYNVSSNDLLDYFSELFCDGLLYTCSVLIALPIIIAGIIWFGKCCTSLKAWWILQLIIDLAAFIASIFVSLIFTIALAIFCGDVYDRTRTNCLNGVGILDATKKKRMGAKVALEFLAVAVGLSWFIVFFWLLTVLLVTIHLATSYYQSRITELETKAEDMEFSLQQQTLLLNQRRPSYNFDPPQLNCVCNPRIPAGADYEPLIQL